MLMTQLINIEGAIESQFKVVGQVYETDNYSLFGYIKGNREISSSNLKKVTESLKKRRIKETSILVGYVPDDKDGKIFHILDGQHRFESCKKLGLPISFVVYEDYNPSDMDKSLGVIELLNTASKTWDVSNFMISKAIIGNVNYQRYAELYNKYPIEHEVIFYIFAEITKKKTNFNEFKEGKFELTEEQAKKIDEKLKFLTNFSAKIANKSGKRYYYKALIDASMSPNLLVDRLIERFNDEKFDPSPVTKICEAIKIIRKRYNGRDSHKMELITGKHDRLKPIFVG